QTIVGIFEWLGELDIARREFCCQRVGIGDVEGFVPAGDAFLDVSRVVRYWINAHVLKHNHRSAALDNAEEDVVRWPLKRDLEPETVAIKRQRGGDILDDKERRNSRNFWFSHVVSTRVPELSRVPYAGTLIPEVRSFLKPSHYRGFGLGLLLPLRLSATASRMSSFKAASSILSPSWMSMARLTFPSRLELKRPAGSFNAAPFANVSLTAFLYVSPVQTMPPWEKTGVPGDVALAHFHSSTISGSTWCMMSRTFASVWPRQSPSSLIFWSMIAEADSIAMLLSVYSSNSRAYFSSPAWPTGGASKRWQPRDGG